MQNRTAQRKKNQILRTSEKDETIGGEWETEKLKERGDVSEVPLTSVKSDETTP